MKVILLERIGKLGTLGQEVSVKPGYARNFLIPQGKALRATADNIAYFEKERKAIEDANAKRRDEASKIAKTMDGLTVDLIRQASEGGQLYGSVAAKDIADAVNENSEARITRGQIELNLNLKTLGLFTVPVTLHPEVIVNVTVNIARSEDEAKIQRETGKALIATLEEEDEVKAEAAPAADADTSTDTSEEAAEASETAEETASEDEAK